MNAIVNILILGKHVAEKGSVVVRGSVGQSAEDVGGNSQRLGGVDVAAHPAVARVSHIQHSGSANHHSCLAAVLSEKISFYFFVCLSLTMVIGHTQFHPKLFQDKNGAGFVPAVEEVGSHTMRRVGGPQEDTN